MTLRIENGQIQLDPGRVDVPADTVAKAAAHSQASPAMANAQALEQEMDWFRRVLETRLALYFHNDCVYQSIDQVPVPDLSQDRSEYARLVKRFAMSSRERLVLMLATIPHLRPQLLNLFLIRDPSIDKPYVEFGGWRGSTHHGFLPTGETAAFLLAGEHLQTRIEVLALFDHEHFFSREGIIDLQRGNASEAYLTAALVLSTEYFHRITRGQTQKPDFSAHFPAKRLQTRLAWDDLVLPPKVLSELEHLRTWLANQERIMFEMGLEKSITPGYRALFYGPPGTGKTLTASLLGKSLSLDVYRIDLSAVVSKYIGETEKNLETLFKQAENRRWILFFDEADALFGKRTETSSANDRHANQEVAYLLQRIEHFPGVILLATNLRANIDQAFSRRFQSMTYFPMPDTQQRLHLWQQAFRHSDYLHPDVDLQIIAKDYELAGGAIINVVRFAAIAMLRDGREHINQQDLQAGMTKEMKKLGRIIG